MSEHFDLVILGAGSGGLSVAAGAAQMGARVALLEPGEMGGDCLNSGCVPSKALLAAGKAAQGFRTANRFGIAAQEPQVDFAAVKAHVRSVIAAIEPNDSVERFEGLGVTVIRAAGRFTSPTTLQAADRTLIAKRFVIATGSRASLPPVPGLETVPAYTNEDIFGLQQRPDHLLIIGGGPIGCEMAQAHRRLGCAVTLVERFSLLAKDDPDCVDIVRQALVGEGVRLIEQAAIARAEPGPVLVLENGERLVGSHVLVAAGRAPNIADLGLEAAGVAYGKRGIQVDARLRTSNKRIFAIGDCREGPQFTHAAGYDAGIVIQNALFRLPAKASYAAMPWVTFTDPELAHVGLAEAEARKAHGAAVQVLRWSFHENDRAQAERHTEGLIKVAVAQGRVVGATIAGPHAGELIQLWTLAVGKRMKLRDLTGFVAPYPTYAEVSKRAAGSAFTSVLFGSRVKALVRLLLKLP
jgi:pyruvate/2-oxoglutarate dehydrogenase complex dihydrolipoamide dehydrogenase (E3) component